MHLWFKQGQLLSLFLSKDLTKVSLSPLPTTDSLCYLNLDNIQPRVWLQDL